ncbi:MAG TPA: zf-HC2 domain-containing protein [Drouetiella sp.]
MSNIACEQLDSLLSAYRDGELSEAEHREAEGHISQCASCQNKLIELDAVVHALKSLPRMEPQRDYAADIEQLIAAQPAVKAPSRRRPIVWGGIGVAAAAAVMIAVGTIKPTVNVAPTTASTAGVHRGMEKPVAGGDSEIASISDSDFVALHGGNDEASSDVVDVKLHHAQPAVSGSKEGGHNSEQTKQEADPNRKKNSKFNPKVQVANNSNVGSDVVPGSASQAQSRLDAESTQVADNAINKTNMPDSNLVAVYETDQKGVTEELGITTDEDGLYAIKL